MNLFILLFAINHKQTDCFKPKYNVFSFYQALVCLELLERRETLDSKAHLDSKVNPAHLDSPVLKDRLETRVSGAVTVSQEVQVHPE